VIIARGALDEIVAHARATQPLECCGILVGRGDRITDVVAARNLEASPTRYLIDPRDHIRARRRAREAGDEILGFYHSHPASLAVPSARDISEASYPECVWLIVGLRGEVDVRLFAIADGSVTQLPLTVDEAQP
jgi:[CysO sulfur-carrier protein]-S-L-cysteine hydrolase